MRFCFILIPAFCLFAQAQSPELRRAEEEVARIQVMVDKGVMPKAALLKALSVVEEARDMEVLRSTLYGQIDIESLTVEQSDAMLSAARRNWDRQQARLDATRKLVDAGALPRTALDPFQEEVDRSREIHEQAFSRAGVLNELAEMVRAEEELSAQLEQSPEGAAPMVERFDGSGIFSPAHLKQTVLAFEREFNKPLPISAKGSTALHRSLGYDHRDRVDVAVSPDSKEGQWLREFLQTNKVPYYAFRGRVAGRSTAAHMHLGPPSLRIRRTD